MKTPEFRGHRNPKKMDVIDKEIIHTEFLNHVIQQKIEHYQEYLGNVDASQTGLIAYLDRIIWLTKKKLSLRKELKSLIVMHEDKVLIKPRIVPGDEWKLATGYSRPKKMKIAYAEEKSFPEGYRMDEIDKEVVEIDKEVDFYFKKIEEKYPADALIIETNLESNAFENRTN
jgi:hypothetical protein